MKYSIAASTLLATLASALPAPQSSSSTNGPTRFGGLALRSASPIHYGSINANGLSFWIGKATQTDCPDTILTESACASANKNETIFAAPGGSASTLGLSTTVPGGQQVYVSGANGALKFTQAHSVLTEGAAVFEGFAVDANGDLKFEGRDWVACAAEGSEEYSVVAASRNTAQDCLGFTFLAVEVSESTPSAWQYE